MHNKKDKYKNLSLIKLSRGISADIISFIRQKEAFVALHPI